MLKAPNESIKDEMADRVNSLSVVPVSVASCSFHPNPILSFTFTYTFTSYKE